MTRFSLLNLFFVAAVLVLSSGCWRDASQIDQVTWSDDDEGQAYVVLRFEEKGASNPLSGTTDKRNFRHQIYVQDADGSNRHAVGVERPNQNGASFFYMRSAGYLILNVIESSQVRFDLIRVAGPWVTLATQTHEEARCNSLEVIPSPDGTHVAIIEGLAGSDCRVSQVSVSFVNAATLSEAASYDWAVSGMVEAKWREDGDQLIIATSDDAWLLNPRSAPFPTDPPECIYPRTSSSRASADGVVITTGPSESDPVKVEGHSDDPYGCL